MEEKGPQQNFSELSSYKMLIFYPPEKKRDNTSVSELLIEGNVLI